MGSFFDLDGKFFNFMTKLANLMLLNILFVVCCLPVFTIGASFTAMYTVALKMPKGKEAYIARSFFKAFKENFKQATILWLILMFVGAALFADNWFANRMIESVNNGTASNPQLLSTVATVLSVSSKILFIIWAVITSYVFPVLAKFENTIKNILKNSLIMSITHFIKSIGIVAINLAILVTIFMGVKYIMIALMVYLFIGFSVSALANSYMFVGIFANYIPEGEDEDRESESVLDDDGNFIEKL